MRLNLTGTPPPKIGFFVKFWSIFLALFGQVLPFLRRYTYLAVFGHGICFFVKFSSIYLAVFGQVLHFSRQYTYQYLDKKCVFMVKFWSIYLALDKLCRFYVDIPISIWTRFALFTPVQDPKFWFFVIFRDPTPYFFLHFDRYT